MSGDCDQDGVSSLVDCDDFDATVVSNPNSSGSCCLNPQLIQVDYDADGDGVLGSGDTITEYTYDSNGNITYQTEDINADGSINNSFTFTYNSNNQLESEF